MKLKSKILTIIALITALAVVFTLYQSYSLIEKDKTAQIFESNLNRVENLSDTLLSELNYQLLTLQNVFVAGELFQEMGASSDQEGRRAQYIDRQLEGADRLIAYHFVPHERRGQVSETSTWASRSRMNDHYLDHSDLINWFGVGLESFLNSEEVYLNSSNNMILRVVEIDDHEFALLGAWDSNATLYALLDIGWLRDELTKDPFTINSIWTFEGNEFISTDVRIPPSLIKEISSRSALKGVEELTIAGEASLVSYALIPDLNLVIMGHVYRSDAFAIIGQLLFQSIAFGLIILGAFLILGVFFSHKVTRPIQSLVSATEFVSKGDFSHKVTVNTSDELKILGDSFNLMSSEIESLLDQKMEMIKELQVLNEKLEDYNKNLEQKVEERTKELLEAKSFIQAMVDSLDQGLLVFNSEGKCLDIYTKACENIFGSTPSDKMLADYLELGESEIQALDKLLPILFEEKIPFDSAVGLAPSEKVYGSMDNVENSEFKFIDLDYHPMRNEEGKLSYVVAVATDKTQEVQGQKAFEKEKAKVQMILKIVQNQKPFINFMKTIEQIFEKIKEEIQAESPSVDNFMFHFHTLNGGLGTYQIFDIQKFIRSIEDQLGEFKRGEKEITQLKRFAASAFEDLTVIWDGFVRENSFLWESGQGEVSLYPDDIEFLEQMISDSNNLKKDLSQFLSELKDKERVDILLTGHFDLVEQISEKLGKPMRPCHVIGGRTRIDLERFGDFISSLVHVFRNSVDHGIEDSETRRERQKPAEGKITIKSQIQGDHWHFTVEDDGGGINTEKVREKAREIMPDEDVDQFSDEQVDFLIFHESFSTRDEVSEFSGRGVGMSAVKQEVESLGGEIEIKNERGRGAQFNFTIPI